MAFTHKARVQFPAMEPDIKSTPLARVEASVLSDLTPDMPAASVGTAGCSEALAVPCNLLIVVRPCYCGIAFKNTGMGVAGETTNTRTATTQHVGYCIAPTSTVNSPKPDTCKH